jgi:ABC-type transporter Mla MlaB component
MAAGMPRTINVAIGGRLRREDLPELRGRIVTLVQERTAELAVCDVTGLHADAVSVEALGLLQLAGRRQGWRIRLANPTGELVALIAFMGLADVLSEL